MSAECYRCARRLDLGHHGGCPALETSGHKLAAFLGHTLAARPAATRPEPATPTEEADTQPIKVSTGASGDYCLHPIMVNGRCQSCGQKGAGFLSGYLTGSGVLA